MMARLRYVDSQPSFENSTTCIALYGINKQASLNTQLGSLIPYLKVRLLSGLQADYKSSNITKYCQENCASSGIRDVRLFLSFFDPHPFQIRFYAPIFGCLNLTLPKFATFPPFGRKFPLAYLQGLYLIPFCQNKVTIFHGLTQNH